MKNFQKQKNKKWIKGFTLVETLVAISIFSSSILALSAVLSNGISNTDYAQRKIMASYLAQEGIEYVRNIRDYYVVVGTDNWNQFKSKLSSCNIGQPCGYNDTLLPDETGAILTNCSSGICTENGFTKNIWMENIGSGNDQVKIFSKVSWVQGSGNFEVTFSEVLFDWVDD